MKTLNPILYLFVCVALVACASIGSPDGGRFDEEPPRVVATSPVDRSLRQSHVRKLRITFNEYVKLENASEKVIVSPPQQEQPDLYTSGKSVVMTLYDTLQANTTYTIDFGDAIVDNNEGNPLGNYTYSFSTGDEIDTLAVGGHVVNAANLEPLKGILVGLYRVGPEAAKLRGHEEDARLRGCEAAKPDFDSLFLTTPFERVSRTDGNGCFSIKGVAPGRYRIYALQDMDGDYHLSQKSEILAFDHTLEIEPWCARDLRHDTLWIDSTRYERILHTPYMHFYPDDIVLRAFIEEGQARHLLKSERPDPLRFRLFFTAPSDTLPQIEVMDSGDIVNDSLARHIMLHANATRDTLNYWVTDTALAYRDTLVLRVSYLETDTTDRLVPRSDTLRLLSKVTRAKQIKEREANVDKWHKQQLKRLERYGKKMQKFSEQYPDSVYPYPDSIDTVRSHCPEYSPTVSMVVHPSGAMSAAQNLRISCPEPIAHIDTAHISFQLKVDSLLYNEPYHIERDSLNPCILHFYAAWQPGAKYQLNTDSLTFTTIYGKPAQPVKRTVSINSMDSYGALFVQLMNTGIENAASPDAKAVVQLVAKGDKLLAESVADGNGRADFFFISPGTYYLRCFIDSNGDGKWTTGDYRTGRQPETVYYFPRPLNIRAKWEVEQQWSLGSGNVMEQKPAELIKQKEKKRSKRTAHERNLQRDKENKYGQADKKADKKK